MLGDLSAADCRIGAHHAVNRKIAQARPQARTQPAAGRPLQVGHRISRQCRQAEDEHRYPGQVRSTKPAYRPGKISEVSKNRLENHFQPRDPCCGCSHTMITPRERSRPAEITCPEPSLPAGKALD